MRDSEIHRHEGLPASFRCYPQSQIGTARCLECGDDISLDIVFNTYFHYVEKGIEVLDRVRRKEEFGDEASDRI